mgnify:CR=1 FL=1
MLTGLDFKVVGGGFDEGKFAYGLEVVAYSVEGVKVRVIIGAAAWVWSCGSCRFGWVFRWVRTKKA